jgi:hypothetical protein
MVLGLYILFSVIFNHKDILFHTFPFGPLFGARISGAGMGGRDMTSSNPLPTGA